MSTGKFFGRVKIQRFIVLTKKWWWCSYQPFNWKSIFSSLLTKLKLPSLLSSYSTVHVCMLLWTGIDSISQHSTLTSIHINCNGPHNLSTCISTCLSNIKYPYGFTVFLKPFSVNGSCVIALCSVSLQGLWALDTLFIHYKLLVLCTSCFII